MSELENFLDVARELLQAPGPGASLYEHTQRVLSAAQEIVELPELSGRRIDRRSLFIAAIFHEVAAGSAVASDPQGAARGGGGLSDAEVRSRSADMLAECIEPMLPARQIERVGRIIRESTGRDTEMVEAQVLCDAINLDDIGALGIWHELRRYAAAGRCVAEALISWQRKIEYNYWQARLRDGFRFRSVRRLARQRLEAASRFMEQLKREHFAEDLAGSPQSEPPGADTE